MILYAESSAVLAWLLGEKAETEILSVLQSADKVVASELTLIECDRAIWRAIALGKTNAMAAQGLMHRFAEIAAQWQLLGFSQEIVARARQPFPEEPIRTLDALHVAAALQARTAFPGLVVLSLDDRVRRVAGSLGFSLEPLHVER